MLSPNTLPRRNLCVVKLDLMMKATNLTSLIFISELNSTMAMLMDDILNLNTIDIERLISEQDTIYTFRTLIIAKCTKAAYKCSVMILTTQAKFYQPLSKLPNI